MREKDRNSIEIEKMLPQFTTMNVIDGQAGLIIYSSLIFYSLTIDNILNIIVLLILAAVSIATLTGENGILSRANDAKEQTIIAEEKEEIAIAVMSIKGTRKVNNDELMITAQELEAELKNNTKKDIQVTGNGILTVEYKETKHVYEVDNEGNIKEPNIKENVQDTTPGEFEGDGSQNNPYKLKSIEDLVGLSKKVNAGETYSGKYFELDTDLDFNSNKSYVDATRSDMGDINHDGNTEELKKELTTGRGFEPIGYNEWSDIQKIDTNFDGIIDGKNHTIYNLYQDLSSSGGYGGFVGKSDVSNKKFKYEISKYY